jgi:tRNA-Thr(GGU) m(6)t(6)A37 methyltransferase TsaA
MAAREETAGAAPGAPGVRDADTRLELRSIGRIRTRFVSPAATPIQPAYADGAAGEVWVDEPYAAALDDLDGFERIWLLYWMDRASAHRLHVVPYRDTRERGLFATRAPSRPNPIGMSAVTLVRREGRVLYVCGVDVLDGTPLLDIKPYVPEFDAHPTARAGWLDQAGVDRRTADTRFHDRGGSGR